MTDLLKKEKLMLLGLIATIFAYTMEHTLIANGRSLAFITAVILIIVIIGVAIRVAHHAEVIAEKIGEPYGTMVLTLSAVLVEVIILVIMMSHEHSPTLARDTIYAAIMLDMNGIIGLAALLGGLRHGEQVYNDDAGKTYVVMIMTAVGISMLVPEFLPTDKWTYYSVFTIGIMIVLYALFLKMQTGRHSYFFHYSYADKNKLGNAEEHSTHASIKPAIILLIIGIILTGALAEVMSTVLNTGVKGLDIPPILLGLVVATISASPEILTALKAALANRMQPVINIALGATLSTVILTIPVVEAVALITGQQITMGLTIPQTVMVVLTLFVGAINLNDGETNAIEGMTHFVLFATFIMLSILGL
ncbi:calcium:proton antiporter [Entomomonas moraniae]|uniref:Calcium:proton antiporter n=1 Tax=Entomomonas moraniae TaxID=2213226 RepID=A0A3Q9JIT9_9GAMM|nr:calcium:proton antiporter [Entomomonas moraniae]AZS50541.1 calcium:proton antiporter [Entomomonas moraniae]